MISRFPSQIHDPSSCTAQKSESHDTEVERHPPKQYHIPSEKNIHDFYLQRTWLRNSKQRTGFSRIFKLMKVKGISWFLMRILQSDDTHGVFIDRG